MSIDDVEFDQDGFIRNPDDWSLAIAQDLARTEGISPMIGDHWKVIARLRQHYLEKSQIPAIRHVCREAGLDEHRVRALLEDPTRAWRIAGLPNPREEATAYLKPSGPPE